MVILNEWIFESYLLINASIFCPVICFNQFFDDSYQLICVILELSTPTTLNFLTMDKYFKTEIVEAVDHFYRPDTIRLVSLLEGFRVGSSIS